MLSEALGAIYINVPASSMRDMKISQNTEKLVLRISKKPMIVNARPSIAKPAPRLTTIKKNRIQGDGLNSWSSERATVAIKSNRMTQPPPDRCDGKGVVKVNAGLKMNPKSDRNAAPPAMNSPHVRGLLISMREARRWVENCCGWPNC